MEHWQKQANQWSYLGAPLKPSAIDLEKCQTWINEKFQASFYNKNCHVLVLGATPELIHLAWPKNTVLFAIDNNFSMLQTVLPAKSSGIAANWLQLPLAHSSIDLVIGDGCYNSLAIEDYSALNTEIRRILKPKGLFIMRFFTRPPQTESIASIHSDLFTGKIRNFHAFKLRLLMSLYDDSQQAVCLKNVWEAWSHYFEKNSLEIKKLLQCEFPIMNTINVYKNSKVSYTFPTLAEIDTTISSDFTKSEIFFPNYYLGKRCPTFKFTSLNP